MWFCGLNSGTDATLNVDCASEGGFGVTVPLARLPGVNEGALTALEGMDGVLLGPDGVNDGESTLRLFLDLL